ncbi:replicative DNA helicase [Jeotgalibacillus terrae]|uniref:Replicative DNA helicase n=1 Tax=Jeotgalibacillus terrae TaxID=587735 RepID=A0ABW5ZG48_9BACL|nr:replicative DNA helicase [Jeotgalibacillus terrae]
MDNLQQPFNQEAEYDIISALMQKPELLDEMSIKPDHFYQHKTRTMFKALNVMKEANQPIELTTIAEQLRKMNELENAGNISGLLKLMNFSPTTAVDSLKYKEKLVFEKFQYRELLSLSDKLRQIATEQRDLSEVMAITDKLNNIDSVEDNKRRTIGEVLVEVFDDIEKRSNQLEEVTGIRTGFADVDRILNGLHTTELAIIAARPSMGKTALALNFATGITNASNAIPVVYSLETTNRSLVERQLVATARIDAQRLRAGHVADEDWSRITYAMGELGKKDMYYHDLSHCTPGYIRADLKQLKKLHPDRKLVVVIDHLQLMKSDKREPNRNAEVGSITRDLKMIAKELDVSIVLLSQLSRGVESRQDKRPMMSDLRDSGEVEQNADVIAFLYRDDYYDKESENQNIVEFIVAKQRNGPVGTVSMAFIKEMNKFVNLERRLDHAN